MQSKTEAYSGAEGSYRVTSYNVFPGIELIYNDISLCEHDFRPEEGKALLEIHHCRSGRMECRIGADFFYLAPGDLSISLSDGAISHSSFPTGSYEGVTIRINGKDAPRCLSCFLADVNVQPDALREKFGEGAIIRAAFVDDPQRSMAGGLSKHRRTGVTKPVPDPGAENRKKSEN